MVEDRILEKLTEAAHKKAYRKYRREYEALLAHLNGDKTNNKMIAALGDAVRAASACHGMMPYDVQLLSAIVITHGGILEINTGEGKTLIAAISACALASMGRYVHVYTPNDYLSQRDAHFTSMMAREMGLECSAITDNMDADVKRHRLNESNIIYSTERGIIFSFINDNANYSPDQDILPRDLDFLIIDEADSILIDNGETPYILSGAGENLNARIEQVMSFARMLNVKVMDHKNFNQLENLSNEYHAIGDAHSRNILLTDKGHIDFEEYLVAKGIIADQRDLYRGDNVEYIQALRVCLVALHTYSKDVHYVVTEGKVLVVDDHTGRILPTVRMNGNIHQAIEVKENVAVNPDSLTKGKITLEAFVSRYRQISGMTGTAREVKRELKEFFGLRVYCIPSNKPTGRIDLDDKFFASRKEKHRAIVEDVIAINQTNQPILVGASSVGEAETISSMLDDRGIKHVLLTPKHAEHEAEIISQAGRPGRITVTTNMAGRGTDITLGIDPKKFYREENSDDENASVKKLAATLREGALATGGLHVIGTERSRSPRVDRQLIGRSGRQGDPGSSQFYVSPDDAIFEAMAKNRNSLRALFNESGNPLIYKMFKMSIRKIQADIQNYSIEQKKQERKRFGVHEQQMIHYYSFRSSLKYGDDDVLCGWMQGVLERGIQQLVLNYVDHEGFDERNIEQCEMDLYYFAKHVMYLDVEEADVCTGTFQGTSEALYDALSRKMHRYLDSNARHEICSLLRESILDVCDEAWVKNIARVEDAYQTIHLRSYAGEKPDLKYQQEAFTSYKIMVIDILISSVSRIAAVLSMLEDEDRKIA